MRDFFNRHFSQEETQQAREIDVKSLVVREMKIKAMVWYQPTLTGLYFLRVGEGDNDDVKTLEPCDGNASSHSWTGVERGCVVVGCP